MSWTQKITAKRTDDASTARRSRIRKEVRDRIGEDPSERDVESIFRAMGDEGDPIEEVIRYLSNYKVQEVCDRVYHKHFSPTMRPRGPGCVQELLHQRSVLHRVIAHEMLGGVPRDGREEGLRSRPRKHIQDQETGLGVLSPGQVPVLQRPQDTLLRAIREVGVLPGRQVLLLRPLFVWCRPEFQGGPTSQEQPETRLQEGSGAHRTQGQAPSVRLRDHPYRPRTQDLGRDSRGREVKEPQRETHRVYGVGNGQGLSPSGPPS